MRATTVILEEDGSLEDATTVNFILPNKPHATALQVEEIGSYKLEQHEQSVSYQILEDGCEGKTRIYTQGIIDEIDSDTDHKGMRTSVTTSRNVSINSVSEDEGQPITGIQVKRELYVDEQTKNVELDDGYAEIKVKRIVLQEEEVTTAEIHEADENRFDIGAGKRGITKDLERDLDEKKSRAKVASVEAASTGENDDLAQHPRVNRQSSLNNDKSRKGSLYNIEEKNENADLTPEEAKQQRIKEIRAKARRASLLNKEPKTDNNLLDDDENAVPNKAAISNVGDETDSAQHGELFDKRTAVEEVDSPKLAAKQADEQSIVETKARRASLLNKEPKTDNNLLDDDENATPNKAAISSVGDETDNAQQAKLLDKRATVEENDSLQAAGKRPTEQSIETSSKLLNGSKSTIEPEDERDDYLENLLKRAQRQRSVLDDITESKSAAEDNEAPSKKKVHADVEEATPAEVDQPKRSVDSAGIQIECFYCESFYINYGISYYV